MRMANDEPLDLPPKDDQTLAHRIQRTAALTHGPASRTRSHWLGAVTGRLVATIG